MAESKTKANDASVEDYIASRANDGQYADCKALMSIFKTVTKQQPRMWGPSIVGCGSYRYTYESGRTGEMRCCGMSRCVFLCYLFSDEQGYIDSQRREPPYLDKPGADERRTMLLRNAATCEQPLRES
jgi:hypothetical protein